MYVHICKCFYTSMSKNHGGVIWVGADMYVCTHANTHFLNGGLGIDSTLRVMRWTGSCSYLPSYNFLLHGRILCAYLTMLHSTYRTLEERHNVTSQGTSLPKERGWQWSRCVHSYTYTSWLHIICKYTYMTFHHIYMYMYVMYVQHCTYLYMYMYITE